MNKLHQFCRLLGQETKRLSMSCPANTDAIAQRCNKYMDQILGELEPFTREDIQALELAITAKKGRAGEL